MLIFILIYLPLKATRLCWFILVETSILWNKTNFVFFLLCLFLSPVPISQAHVPPDNSHHHHHHHLCGSGRVPPGWDGKHESSGQALGWGLGAISVSRGRSPQASRLAGALFTLECSRSEPLCGGGAEVWGGRQRGPRHAWTEHDQFGCSQSPPGSALHHPQPTARPDGAKQAPCCFSSFHEQEESLGKEQGSQTFLENSWILSAW